LGLKALEDPNGKKQSPVTILGGIPSGKLTLSYGKSPSLKTVNQGTKCAMASIANS
jgi:hypothetical protein